MARAAHDSLSIHRSFVVQLYPASRRYARLAGRVEHAVSGEAAEFRSVDELVGFFNRWRRQAASARTHAEERR